MPEEALQGIVPDIHQLIETDILKACLSLWNMPLLLVKKPNGHNYSPVQDLSRVIESGRYPSHSAKHTPSPKLPPSFTCLVYNPWLKGSFSSIALAPVSQPILAYEWCKADKTKQLTWTILPQGFKSLSTLFNETFSQNLETYQQAGAPTVILIQYVNDLFLTSQTMEYCQRVTRNLFEELGRLGYQASTKKAQIFKQMVTYLVY